MGGDFSARLRQFPLPGDSPPMSCKQLRKFPCLTKKIPRPYGIPRYEYKF